MECRTWIIILIVVNMVYSENIEDDSTQVMSREERLELQQEARKMVNHAYRAYMDNAYPADELMPLSCKGRYRGVTPSRGDMDDVLGNFSLTLVDSLDTLVVMGDFAEFSRGVRLVVRDVSFDTDVVVSVFETNIRMLGGLLSAHILATQLQPDVPTLSWYRGELLALAEDLGRRLLPAFNTTTGIPHGRINLRHGLKHLPDSRETCTACAGTMILEMAALSRLTDDPLYERAAHRAMDRLWNIRHRTSDLMGTVINIHSGDWVRKDSGVGAGIDSYYEYCLKAYVLLGDEKYLARFNRHYNAVMKYVSKGPIMLDVHMHRPHLHSRNFMDALLAFWPGLQVLSGDLRPAVETHEMLYQVMRRHTFIPDAFTSDFQVHWAHHPLRPEFVESTYHLHRATGDDHYLRVGRAVLRALQRHTRVQCGYAAVGDVRTRTHEDRMDSFVIAETFKYLYMLFGYDADLPIRLDDFVLTTEAHFLPLELGVRRNASSDHALDDADKYKKTCPNTASLLAASVRRPLRALVQPGRRPPAHMFVPSDPAHLAALADMGISVMRLHDGRVQLLYTTNTAKSTREASEGLSFMREMSKWTEVSESASGVRPVAVMFRDTLLQGGPAHFGREFVGDYKVVANIAYANPPDACSEILNPEALKDRIAVAVRGDCTFAQKMRNLSKAGAVAALVADGADASAGAMFAMSGDGRDDIDIPGVFLFHADASALRAAHERDPLLQVTLAELAVPPPSCPTGPQTPSPDSQASIEHLKKVLGRLVAQVERTIETQPTSDDIVFTQRSSYGGQPISQSSISQSDQAVEVVDPS